MAFDSNLAARVRSVLSGTFEVTERQMFGGLAFMVAGKMFCGVVKDELMVRVGPEDHEAALGMPGAPPMDFTGRPMTGMVFVGSAGYESEGQLQGWLRKGYEFASSLPVTEAGSKGRRKRA